MVADLIKQRSQIVALQHGVALSTQARSAASTDRK
jgi:hypothetical protein